MALLIGRPPDGSERRIPLRRRLTSVGMSPESDVPVPRPVAAGHGPAPPLRRPGVRRGVPRRSRHDRQRQAAHATCRLAPGDRIRVGGTEILLAPDEAGEEAEPAAPPAASDLAVGALVRFSERLLKATDVPRLLDELLDALLELTHADKGFLILLEDGELSVKAARNLSRATIEDAVSRVSDSIVQKVVQTRRPLVVSDALHDQEWSSSS